MFFQELLHTSFSQREREREERGRQKEREWKRERDWKRDREIGKEARRHQKLGLIVIPSNCYGEI